MDENVDLRFRLQDEATPRLREMRSKVQDVNADFSRMSKALSGSTLLRDANALVSTVERLGGATKLTAREKAGLNAQLQEAINKYGVLGRTAPKAMVDLEAATRRPADATGFLTTKMIALGAAVGSAVGLVAYNAVRRLGQGIVSLAARGAELNRIRTSFTSLTEAIDVSGDMMLAVSRTRTRGLISDLDLMGAANKAMLLDLPVTAQQMGTMAEAAVALGRAMGQDATKSLDDLITALGRSSPLILDNLGLTVKVGEANEKYAAQLGISTSALTDAQKKTAFFNAAMEAAERKVEELGGIHLTTSDQVGRLTTALGNYVTGAAAAIDGSNALGDSIGGLADAAERAAARMDLLREARANLARERDMTDPRVRMQEAQRQFTGGNEPGLEKEMMLVAARRAGRAALANRPDIGNLFGGPGGPSGASADQIENLDAQIDALVKHMAEIDSLSRSIYGQDRIAAANQLVEAMARGAGVSALTVTAQEQVHKAVGEALDAYVALGQEAPAALFHLHAATESAVQIVGDLGLGVVTLKDEVRGPLAAADWVPLMQLQAMRGELQPMPAALDDTADSAREVADAFTFWPGPSFFSGITGGLSSIWEGMTKGGGLGGLFENIGAGLVQSLGGGLLNQGVGLLSKGIKALFSGIGGPSEAEVAGRDWARDFMGGFESGLDASQLQELQHVVASGFGDREMAAGLISVRDALLEIGAEPTEALARSQDIVDRLMTATKQGPAAVQAVIDEMQGIYDQADAIHDQTTQLQKDAEAAAAAAQEHADAIAGIHEDLFGADDIERANDYVEALGGLENISHLTEDAQRRLRDTVQAAVDAYRAMGQDVPSQLLEILRLTQGVGAATSIWMDGLRLGSGGNSAGGEQSFELQTMTDAQRAAWLAANPGDRARLNRNQQTIQDLINAGVTQAQVDAYFKGGGDEARLGSAFDLPGYATGGFIPPGVTQLAVVHGGRYGEDITPRVAAAAPAPVSMAGVEARLDRLERRFMTMPDDIAAAVAVRR